MAYFTYFGDENGACLTRYDSKEKLLAELNGMSEMKFVGPNDNIPSWESWPDNLLLVIQGEVVVPKPKKVVESFDL